VKPFEEAVASELAWLLRAGVPGRAVHLTVRELVITRFERGQLGAREVSDAVEAAVRAACRLARELDAPDELVETVCRAALEAVRGHGGESARWLADATSTAYAVLDELARTRGVRRSAFDARDEPEVEDEPAWPWLARRLPRW
jgi:hypothetical protein